MMAHRPPSPLAILVLLIGTLATAAPAAAQAVGPKPPPYQLPARLGPPPREGDLPRMDTNIGPSVMAPRNDIVAAFADSYQRGGRPRLAFYWNRQLSDTMGQWYADSRTVSTERRNGGYEGEAQRQRVMESQRRTSGGDGSRPGRSEPWEWEFQDGFLGPFLKAEAQVMDRAAILRIMGAGAEDMDPKTVEVMALQTMADLLVEVLVAESAQSTTGYELRARILDMHSGRLLATVNSRSLGEWNRSDKPVATSRGFEFPNPDDERFGPEGDQKFQTGPNGFEQRRKPPKAEIIGRNLATNVMSRLIPVLDSGTVQGASRTAPTVDPGPSPLPPAKAAVTPPSPTAPTRLTPSPAAVSRSKVAPNQSAVPLPEVETQPLAPPSKAPTQTESIPVETPAPVDEPPMPKATKQ